MIPIQNLLNRIRWDSKFGNAFFEIEYEDRLIGMIKIPMDRIILIDRNSFCINDELGRKISIPLHRVKRVFRNGDIIWSRIKVNK